jgi:iron complex transport system substrate-binding protein
MKAKILALFAIAIVLCSLFLVAMPAIAADQIMQKERVSAMTASEDDYVLGIYGNANEDDTIDMRDLTYVKLIFFGERPETELADAKYDAEINPLDFVQIKLIIVGKENELTLIDSSDSIVTVRRPIKRIVVFPHGVVETMRSLKLEKDKIVGLDKWTKAKKIYYPEISEYAADLGSITSPDYEKLLELQPDTVIQYSDSEYFDESVNKIKEADPKITVLRFDCWKQSTYFDEVKRLGYALGKKEEADEFLEFYEECLNSIKEKVEGIAEDERQKVYFEHCDKPYFTTGNKGGWHKSLEMAGGNNIFGDLSVWRFEADPEEVIKCNPTIIVRKEWPEGGYDSDDITELIPARDEIMSRPELANVAAVKNGRVYVIPTEIFADARFVVGIAYLAKWFHPDLFKDLDPQAIHKEYLERFQGMPYRGFYAYPEPN